MMESSHRFSRRSPARKREALLLLTFILAFTCICVLTTAADELRITKILFRRIGPDVAPESFSAKPTTIYLAGGKYWRIEEPPDPERSIHNLHITREPDSWLINLVDKTARHSLDPGPTFIARIPIVWAPKPNGQQDPNKEFQDLEFGNEVRFFRLHKARDLGLRKVDEKECKALAIKSGGREVVLLVDPETDKPVQLDVTKDDKPAFSIRYLSYETNLPFDPSLFEPPPDLKITESK
jgi:hypothetical protein